MSIPVAPLYPDSFDSDENLYLVHDSIRLRLREDFNPGDTVIKAFGDPFVAAKMPASGRITLTEQCSDLDTRAVSYHYTTFDLENIEFSGLTVLPGFTEIVKPKNVTNITINVMADDHNNIKDSLIAIQEFAGVKGTEDLEPFGDTLEGRINFLRRLVLQPKAWFTSDLRTGNVPLCVEFKEQAFRLGTDGNTGEVKYTWDFGDQSTISSISTYSTINVSNHVPGEDIDVLVRDEDGGTVKKCYHTPGLYSVKLTVENDFGSDTVEFPNFINARVKAPEEAVVRFVENTSNQNATPGVPPDGSPTGFSTYPKIRSPINALIQIEIQQGENPATPGRSYSGEIIDGSGNPLDPVTDYTWELGDDLLHPNSSVTKASYSVGGVYDLKLRVDTQFGAYRISTYEDSIDVIENTNIWLWSFLDSENVRAYEFGLISETFKLTPASTLNISRNSSFLESNPNSEQQIKEFKRNNGFAPRGTLKSGAGGTTMLYWASGRNTLDPPASETINVVEYDGFAGVYISRSPINRQWNWANLNSPSGSSFFIFGDVGSRIPNTSSTNTNKQTFALSSFSISNNNLIDDNYLNGAIELEQNPSVFDETGESIHGHFSVYKTAWKDQTGYLCRNDGVGPFFRIKSFYRTEGSVGNPFINIRKLPDIQGPTKLEGEITDLSSGIYLLSNSGSVSKFNDMTETWSTGGPGANSLLYRSLQDTSVLGFDDPANSLKLASDGDKRAYLSFDYSSNAFIKFSEIDLTFSTLVSRPEGEQWLMEIY